MIFIISRGLPSVKSPMNGIFEFDQAKSLINAGLDIIFVVLDFRSFRRIRRFGAYYSQKEGVKCFVISFPLGNIENKLFNYIARKLTSFCINTLIRDYGKPNLIHSHFLLISSIAIVIKNKFKIPLIITEHSSDLNSNYIRKRLINLALITYKNADLVISVSKSLSNNLFKQFNINSIVINNIVNPDVFNFNSKKNNNKEFIFVSVGDLEVRKGFDLLLNAFFSCNFDKSVKLYIVGKGSLYDKLLDFIQERDLSNQVYLLGYKSRLEISKIFLRSNVFVLPSRRETFGVVFVEALFSGLPVIATPCGGPEEYINNNNGILVPIDDEVKLINSLEFMRKNFSNFNRGNISNDAKKKFSPGIIAEELINQYQNFL